ncbi:MAG TPA: cyclic nucleotide-binding domain-containing protein [Ilumatobacteraceae bacterium]|nr:cyclic nucleotide-binding domain-containing protein [Ilumatobacteraceae bacterium]
MTSRSVYVEHLQRVALFSGLTKKELGLVAAAGTEVDVAAGTVIMEQGRRGVDAFVILKGTFVVRRNGRKVAVLSAGDIFGELALLDDGLRSATVECTGDGSVLALSGGQFRAVVDNIPALSHKLLASMAGRIRNLDRTVLG